MRFGLHPLLYRPVTALSTGEIRKVMLARALATRPSLLVLDNAFDGLDVPSREALKELISTTLNGFGQLLVQGVDASATAHTQVLMFTHRAEEIVDEIASVSFLGGGVGGTPSGASCRREGLLYTEARDGRSADQLMRAAFEDQAKFAAQPPVASPQRWVRLPRCGARLGRQEWRGWRRMAFECAERPSCCTGSTGRCAAGTGS